jgi:hypothetical protein
MPDVEHPYNSDREKSNNPAKKILFFIIHPFNDLCLFNFKEIIIEPTAKED